MKSEHHYATGRRKSAIARVWIRVGSGRMKVNNFAPLAYFDRDSLVKMVDQPLDIINARMNFDIEAKVHGGGKSAQADAVRLGIARALLLWDESLRPALRQGGMLTRDPREKERKKFGQPGARKRFQYSKR